MPGSREEDFLRIHQFYTFPPKITSSWGSGSWNLQLPVSLPYRCYIPNLVKIGPVVLENKMLTHYGRQTMDDGRQPLVIGHLSYSGNLKMIRFLNASNKFSLFPNCPLWKHKILYPRIICGKVGCNCPIGSEEDENTKCLHTNGEQTIR